MRRGDGRDRQDRRPRPDRHAYAYREQHDHAAALCRGGGAAGTTTLCWDPHEVGNVLGLAGVRWAVEARPGSAAAGAECSHRPACRRAGAGARGRGVRGAEMAQMLSWPEVLGVAEVMDMRGVLERQPHMAGIVGAGLASAKLVCGHARGPWRARTLQGFAAAGIESDHEVTSTASTCSSQAARRLHRRTARLASRLRAARGARRRPDAACRALPPTLTLCTDDVFPDDLIVAVGGMVEQYPPASAGATWPAGDGRAAGGDAERRDCGIGQARPRPGGGGAASPISSCCSPTWMSFGV